MSRSFKKGNWVKDPNNKYMKRFANKKVRNSKDVPSGKAYKKVFSSYDISDYKWMWTKKDAIYEYYNGLHSQYLKDRFATLEEYLKYWEKCVKRK